MGPVSPALPGLLRGVLLRGVLLRRRFRTHLTFFLPPLMISASDSVARRQFPVAGSSKRGHPLLVAIRFSPRSLRPSPAYLQKTLSLDPTAMHDWTVQDSASPVRVGQGRTRQSLDDRCNIHHSYVLFLLLLLLLLLLLRSA